MRNTIKAAYVMGGILAVVNCSSTPPACAISSPPGPPDWDLDANADAGGDPSLCSADYMSNWPSGVKQVQLDIEWMVYDADLLFDALPVTLQTPALATFTSVRQAVITADEAFVATVQALIAAGNQDFVAAIVEVTLAATDIYNEVVMLGAEFIGNATSGCGTPSAAQPGGNPSTANDKLNDITSRYTDLKSHAD